MAAEHKTIAAEQKATDQQLKELGKQTDRQLKELGKQIGGIGDKFGYFTEGLALPSMEKILHEQFHMEFVSPRVKGNKKGRFSPPILLKTGSRLEMIILCRFFRLKLIRHNLNS